VTDEQRARRPIFISTLWAGTSWPFFRVTRSTRMIQIWALARALINNQLTSGKIPRISGTGHYARCARLLSQFKNYGFGFSAIIIKPVP
jgi:hypothetical protein